MQSNALIYCRVSDEDQIKENSLDGQEDACKKRASDLGLNVPDDGVYREEGKSAWSEKIDKRPELMKLIQRARSKKNNVSVSLSIHLAVFSGVQKATQR